MSYSQVALNAYKQTKVKTAGQGQLIVMLYEEAVKQLQIAVEAMDEKNIKNPENIEKANKGILKTQEIITELMASLDFEAGGEIATNLFSIYSFFNRELMAGNIEKDKNKILTVRNLMDQLRTAWIQIAATTKAQANPTTGINVAG